MRPITGSSLRSRASWVKLRPNWSRIWLLPLSPAGSSLVEPPTLAPAVPLRLGAPGRALVAGQQLDDLLADARQVGAELDEHLGGDALALADQAEQDVLGADVVVAQLEGFAQRQLEDLLGPRGERDVPGRRRAALADDLLDLVAHGLQRDAEALEGLGGDALTLVDEAEQDVLGADVGVVEQARFLLGEDDDPAGPIGESFEHVRPFQPGTTSDQCTGAAEPAVGCSLQPADGSLWNRSGAVVSGMRQAEHTRCHPARRWTTTTDELLVGRARAGDRAAYGELVRRHQARGAPAGGGRVRIDRGGKGHRAGRVRQGLPLARSLSGRRAGAVVAAADRGQRGEERGPRPQPASSPGAPPRAAAPRGCRERSGR